MNKRATRQKVAISSSTSGSFLKWVGGKTRYARVLSGLAPTSFETFREPFMGSAAVYFEAQPPRAVLSDANAELVRAFWAVRDEPDKVMALLDIVEDTKETFMAVRAQDTMAMSDVERGARLIYLNKRAFRGLWRVNRKGGFNVPWGAYLDRPLYVRQMILACSAALQDVEILEQDFEPALDAARPGDFVYVDPPYVPDPDRVYSDFKRYTPGQFHDADHVRLAAAMLRAADRGAFVLMTNSDNPTTRKIFKDFQLTTMATRRDVNLRGSTARASTDLLASSYELPAPVLF